MKPKALYSVAALALTPFTLSAAVTTQQAVNALNLTELAHTYPADQIVTITGNKDGNAYDALLVDIGVLSVSDLKNKAVVSSKLTAFVDDQLNLSEHYLGNVSDKNIIERMNAEWKSSTVIADRDILKLMNSFIDKGYTTGYNIINNQDKSNFDKNRMIRYGHNDINHANQLIYLMKVNGFDPKVQLTPKSSAFLYLPEWGEASYPVIKMDSGKMIAMVKEYNLDFEFQSEENKQRFMTLINQYAKKDSKDEKGLIVESWWQPFYRSYSPMKGYMELAENRIMIGDYQADLMSLKETAPAQKQQIKSADDAYRVVPTRVWVNPSFYRYMEGDFK